MASPARRPIDLLEKLLHATDRLARWMGRAPRGPEHLEVGRRGEDAAYFHLRRNGFTVVAHRWKNALLRGDLDLIAWEGSTLCFVEVKARSSHKFTPAEAAVDEDKKRMLRRLGRQYLRHLPETPERARFDILSIYFERKEAADFELIRGAFDWN